MSQKFLRVCLSLDKETFDMLDSLSCRMGMSKSQFIRFMLTALVNEEKFIYFKKLFEKQTGMEPAY